LQAKILGGATEAAGTGHQTQRKK